MKTAKKLFAALLAVIMVMALVTVPALASGGSSSQTIKINNATAGNTYKVYKVFDAKGGGKGDTGAIVYTVKNDKSSATLPNCFEVDATTSTIKYVGTGTNGELTADDIAAIATYVTEADFVAQGTVKDGEDSVTIDVSQGGYGYYYITTTTGSAVTVTSTNPNATVQDKNEAPELEKNITAVDGTQLDRAGKDALAQIGSKVSYKVTIDVKNGAQNYVFHDKMGSGLTYNERYFGYDRWKHGNAG